MPSLTSFESNGAGMNCLFFVSNRILMAFINESIMTLEDGVADASSIDTVAKLGFNHPMGPIELADFIGLDVCKDIMEAIYAETKNKQFHPRGRLPPAKFWEKVGNTLAPLSDVAYGGAAWTRG